MRSSRVQARVRGDLVNRGLTPAEIRDLPAMVDVVTAGRALGVGRTKSYALARAAQFPCRVLRVGGSYLVPTADLLGVLGLTPAGLPEPGKGGCADGDRNDHENVCLP
jgi:hypothetical protein